MLRLSAILFIVSFSFNVLAKADQSSDQSGDEIDRLFTAMQADQMTQQMWTQMQGLFSQMTQDLNVDAAANEIIKQYQKELVSLLQQEMSWEKMAPEIRHIYAQNFTVDEITKMAEFYESPAGQAFVERMPIVMQESMQLGQRMAMNAMPKLQALSERMREELKEKASEK
ncbi:DUF2059 domain-containing protein [Alteromonas sediminis]|uniref:DUF2059 domain-containing protein n=1 Tax=Alteromonas sediminis TaxID=2259342 RepID=A0A3N5Y309_9ALTE|nr:DUF2059 domain-containing protein [Alteromonas sediminis]RPJ67096.1 DUF2059 domain-containing protein [Alteromonas sediminis]